MKTINLRSAAFIIVVMFVSSLAFSQSGSDYKSKVQSLNKEMAKNMLAGNSEKNLSLYTEDAISMPANEPMADGLPAIRKSNEEMLKSGMKVTAFEPVTQKVMVNGNQITEIGTYTFSMTMPGMDKPIDDHGKYLTIWEKQKDGSLKIKIETWNSDAMNKMGQEGQPMTDKK
jgi:ketosteroid isomerase-like protein